MTVKVFKGDEGITIECKVTPRAKRSAIKAVRDGILMIALKAPPVDGKANKELIAFLSDAFKVKRDDISIIKGEKARMKTVYLRGVALQGIIETIDGLVS